MPNEKVEIVNPNDTMDLLSHAEVKEIPEKTNIKNISLEFNKLTKEDLRDLFFSIPSKFKAKLRLEY